MGGHIIAHRAGACALHAGALSWTIGTSEVPQALPGMSPLNPKLSDLPVLPGVGLPALLRKTEELLVLFIYILIMFASLTVWGPHQVVLMEMLGWGPCGV